MVTGSSRQKLPLARTPSRSSTPGWEIQLRSVPLPKSTCSSRSHEESHNVTEILLPRRLSLRQQRCCQAADKAGPPIAASADVTKIAASLTAKSTLKGQESVIKEWIA